MDLCPEAPAPAGPPGAVVVLDAGVATAARSGVVVAPAEIGWPVRTAAGGVNGPPEAVTWCTPTPAPTLAASSATPAVARPQPLCNWSESSGSCELQDASRPLPSGGGA